MPLKKHIIKKKQNGKKIVKNQMSRFKQNCEMETSPREQISELDKEMFSTKISEYDSKLNRKKHLCSYMEEEVCIYKTLFDEKQLLKSESMKLLNKAFEDFSTEIFLLDQELIAMKYIYNGILQKQMFCLSCTERVQKLNATEDKLVENLYEAEKCAEELPVLGEKLTELQEKTSKGKENFIHGKQYIMKEFETYLLNIQNELYLSINKVVVDEDLRLNLLPSPYKTLYVNGFLSRSWLNSASQIYNSLELQNIEVQKMYSDMLVSLVSGTEKMKTFFSGQNEFLLKRNIRVNNDKNHLSKPKKLKASNVVRKENDKHFLQSEKRSLQQQIKVASMESEIKDLEAAINLLEISGETAFDKSYILQIICKAGSLLKKEL